MKRLDISFIDSPKRGWVAMGPHIKKEDRPPEVSFVTEAAVMALCTILASVVMLWLSFFYVPAFLRWTGL